MNKYKMENQENNKIVVIENKLEIIKNDIYKEGAKILEKNKFFYDLDSIMNNDEFNDFYHKYFKNFNDIKTILLYMKLYETIQHEYIMRYNKPIDRTLIASMIKEMMMDTDCRKRIMSSFNEFSDEKNTLKNICLLDIFEQTKKSIK